MLLQTCVSEGFRAVRKEEYSDRKMESRGYVEGVPFLLKWNRLRAVGLKKESNGKCDEHDDPIHSLKRVEMNCVWKSSINLTGT